MGVSATRRDAYAARRPAPRTLNRPAASIGENEPASSNGLGPFVSISPLAVDVRYTQNL